MFDDRRVGHAENDVRPPATQTAEQCARQIRRVIGRAREELRSLERRRRDADDLDTIPNAAMRLFLLSVQMSGDDPDIQIVRQRLAQLR
jgi:hypothetical protein